MSNITKYAREQIARRAVVHSFDEREGKLKRREAELGIECYNRVFPKAVRDSIAAVPIEWFRTCDCLRFNADGWNVSLSVGKQMPTPAMGNCGMLGTVTGKLAEEVRAYSQEWEKFREERAAAGRKILGFLEGFSTYKKLEAAWPEGKQFYAVFNADRPAAKVPALITKEINDLLGLKTKGKAV